MSIWTLVDNSNFLKYPPDKSHNCDSRHRNYSSYIVHNVSLPPTNYISDRTNHVLVCRMPPLGNLGFSPCPPSSSYSPVMQRPLSSHSPPAATVPSSSHPNASASPPPPTSPISCLPVELLTLIFALVPRIEFEESLQSTPTALSLPKPIWMAISQDFWSYIPLQTSPYWVKVSLARSYPCPISFSIDFSPAPQPEWYRNSALSALRAVQRARPYAARPVTLPGDNSPRRDTTALHSLTLTLCDVYPSFPLFRAPLLSLRLVDCRVEFPLEILSLLPQLHTLVLQNTRGTRISSDVSHLPQLQHLELTNVSSVIAFLLRGITIPSSSSLSITCTDYTDIAEPLDDLTLLNTVTSNMSSVFSTYLEGALGQGCKYPLLEIASPTSTAKKTLVLLDTASDAGTHHLQFSLVWADAPKSIDLFSQFSPYSQLPCASKSTRCACERTPFYTQPTFGLARDEAVRGLLAFVMGQELLPALRKVSLEGVDLKNPNVDMLARVLVDRQRLSTVPGEGKISLSLQNCLMDPDSIRRLRDRLGPDVVDIT
ncbi:hypothetical protein BGY98DRAFT_979252 [Russula aff. rugulosa BPL654]|nr:hypothetical protein BGY98DRAFT_979252 [Russula aff. rugulosa BPL654]